jgi:hypothetical protein
MIESYNIVGYTFGLLYEGKIINPDVLITKLSGEYLDTKMTVRWRKLHDEEGAL